MIFEIGGLMLVKYPGGHRAFENYISPLADYLKLHPNSSVTFTISTDIRNETTNVPGRNYNGGFMQTQRVNAIRRVLRELGINDKVRIERRFFTKRELRIDVN